MSKTMNIRDVLKSEMMRPLAVLRDGEGNRIELLWESCLAIDWDKPTDIEVVECNAGFILNSLLGYIAEMSEDTEPDAAVRDNPTLQMPMSAASRGDVNAMLSSAAFVKNRCLQLSIDDEDLYFHLNHIIGRAGQALGVRHPALKQADPEERPLRLEDPLSRNNIPLPNRQMCQIPIPHEDLEL